jgi:hypothetical protein
MFDLEAILRNPPKLHKHNGELISTWLLHQDAVRAINSFVLPGMPTVETGAGLSTIVFAANGCDHTCIVPDAGLADRIKTFCSTNSIDTDSVEFVIAKSCDVAFRLEPQSRQLALVDGNHGFPSALLDFFYLGKALKIGGILVQDDMHIYTCQLLASFMQSDDGWSIEQKNSRIVIAKKLADTIEREWTQQTFVKARSYPIMKHPILYADATLRTLKDEGLAKTFEKIKSRLQA